MTGINMKYLSDFGTKENSIYYFIYLTVIFVIFLLPNNRGVGWRLKLCITHQIQVSSITLFGFFKHPLYFLDV